jgi:Omp85 superfamily domain
MKQYQFLGATVCLMFFATSIVNGQEAKEKKEKKEKKVSIIPLPVIAANPTTGFMFGVAPGFNWKMGDPKNTSMSTALGLAIYTTNKQLFTSMRANVFLSEDKWNLLSDIRFALNSQPTYGLGTKIELASQTIVGDDGEVSDDPYNKVPRQEMMAFTQFRFYQTVLRRHQDTRFFYGLGYHLDLISNIDDKQLNLDTVPPQETFHYEYQTRKGISTEKYTQSGVSLNLAFDSRDNVANPYKGKYAFARFTVNPTFIGSTTNTSQLWLEYRDYLSLSKSRPRNLLAFWTYGWFSTSGKIPYLFLPALAWDMFGRSGRPYTHGRFRGENLVYGEAEWRFPLQKTKERFGAVIFLNTTTASNKYYNIGLLDYLQFGYGAGLRVQLSAKNRINLCLDYGFGAHGANGFFLQLNEAF